YLERSLKTMISHLKPGVDPKLHLINKIIKVLKKYRFLKFGVPFRKEKAVMSQETRKKLSLALKERHKNNPEYSKKVVKALKAGYCPETHSNLMKEMSKSGVFKNRAKKIYTEEDRRKMSLASTGRKHTEE